MTDDNRDSKSNGSWKISPSFHGYDESMLSDAGLDPAALEKFKALVAPQDTFNLGSLFANATWTSIEGTKYGSVVDSFNKLMSRPVSADLGAFGSLSRILENAGAFAPEKFNLALSSFAAAEFLNGPLADISTKFNMGMEGLAKGNFILDKFDTVLGSRAAEMLGGFNAQASRLLFDLSTPSFNPNNWFVNSGFFEPGFFERLEEFARRSKRQRDAFLALFTLGWLVPSSFDFSVAVREDDPLDPADLETTFELWLEDNLERLIYEGLAVLPESEWSHMARETHGAHASGSYRVAVPAWFIVMAGLAKELSGDDRFELFARQGEPKMRAKLAKISIDLDDEHFIAIVREAAISTSHLPEDPRIVPRAVPMHATGKYGTKRNSLKVACLLLAFLERLDESAINAA